MMRFRVQDGRREHKNYIAELTSMNKGVTGGLGRVASAPKEDFAEEGNCTSIVLNLDGTLKQIAAYTNVGAPIRVPSKVEKGDYFIGSNENNACHLIFIRNINRSEEKKTYFMWHLRYDDLEKVPKKEIKQYLPNYFSVVDEHAPAYSVRYIFSDPNSEVLVTNSSLLSPERFDCAAKEKKMLNLPDDLRIRSMGSEAHIRSYSIAFFPDKDLLLLSGESTDDQSTINPENGNARDYFWLMQDPFSNQNWVKIGRCEDVVNEIKLENSQKNLSELLDDKLKQKIQSNNNLVLQYVHFPNNNLAFQLASIAAPDDQKPLNPILEELDANNAYEDIINCFEKIDFIVHRSTRGLCHLNANALRSGLCEKPWIKESKLGVINNWMPENTTIDHLESPGNYGCSYHAFCVVKTVNDLYIAIEVAPGTINNKEIPRIQILAHKDHDEFLKLLALRYCYSVIYFVSRTENIKQAIDFFYPCYESYRVPEYHVEKFNSNEIPAVKSKLFTTVTRGNQTSMMVNQFMMATDHIDDADSSLNLNNNYQQSSHLI